MTATELSIYEAALFSNSSECEVYSATWHGRHVAVKKYNEVRCEELIHLNRLRHQNLVSFLDVGLWMSKCALVMEYCLQSLEKIRETKESIGFEKSLKWAREISDGMDYLHRKNVVHSDLKCENILVTVDDVIRICDFGMDREKIVSVPSTSTAIATFRHMAPELMLRHFCSQKADIYSYGVILWEMITMQTPYVELTWQQIKEKFGKTRISLTIPSWVPVQVSALLRRCMSYSYAARPAFHEILDALDDIYAAVTISDKDWKSFAQENLGQTFIETKEETDESEQEEGYADVRHSDINSNLEFETSDRQKHVRCTKCFSHHPEETTFCSLYDAVEQDDLAGVLAYLGQPDGEIALEERRLGCTPLMHAAKCGYQFIVRELLLAGADTGLVGDNGPIHLAACSNNSEIVRFLLDHGVDIEMEDSEGWTPLQWAVRYKAGNVVRFLLEQKADVYHMNKGGQAAIHMASRLDCEEVMDLLLDHVTVDVNMRGPTDWTPLHHAAISGVESSIRCLLESGADASIHNEDGNAPIHLACIFDHSTIVAMFLEPKLCDSLLSSEGGDSDQKEANIEAQNLVNIRGQRNWTPLHFAVENYAVDSAVILLVCGADITLKNEERSV